MRLTIQPVLMLALLGWQALVGFRIVRLRGTVFRIAHQGGAYLLGALFLFHGFAPLLTLVQPAQAFSVMVLPVGIALIVLLVVQVLVGFHLIGSRRRFQTLHVGLALVIVGAGTLHGVDIAFGWSHPEPTACESCHKPPANHYAGTCIPCHTRPLMGWPFEHPAVSGQEAHSWRSFACKSCHPYEDLTKVSCTCHENGGVPFD